MSVRVIRIHNCDRCKKDFDPSPYATSMIDHLSFMVKRNGSGCKKSDMDLELCESCSEQFIAFMKDEGF